MDKRGQISMEFIMMVAIIPLMVLLLGSLTSESSELTLALAAARNGATQGANLDSIAMYPDQAFSNYAIKNQRLLYPSKVRVLKVEYTNQGYNPVYQKTKIQIRVYASDPTLKNRDDRNCMGERINYYVRKSISGTFKTDYMSNNAYNPVFSYRYYYTTADVKWS
ncbi:MAG: hypothetical protein ABFC91_03695 [Methanobacteriaceae archaeon]